MMNKMLMKYSFAIVAILYLCSCAHYKDIPYFQNAETFEGKSYIHNMRIMPKDSLVIFVHSSSSEAVALFNLREPSKLRDYDKRVGGIRVSSNSSGEIHKYFVENDGTIDFPVVGRIHLSGLTIQQANDTILEKISPYIKESANCVVNTLINNFEISVLGEVKNPTTFTITRPEVNVLEALAMAGDMTIYGKRNNVKILRELADGTYEVHELDMRDANILNSPYYYLQQRDVVYVEPNEAMAQNAKIGSTTQLWVRGASITISLGSLLYMVLQ